MASGLALNIIGKEKREIWEINEYEPLMRGLGRSPEGVEASWMTTHENTIIQLVDTSKDKDWHIAGASTELSTKVPLADFTNEKRIAEVSPFYIDVAESLDRPAEKSLFSPQMDRSIIAALDRHRDDISVVKLRELTTMKDTPFTGKPLEFASYINALIAEAVEAKAYMRRVDRTLLMPESIHGHLASQYTNKETMVLHLLEASLRELKVVIRPYPTESKECILFVDNALISFDGVAPEVKRENMINEEREQRKRRYGFSTNGYMLSSTASQLPFAMVGFEWNASDMQEAKAED